VAWAAQPRWRSPPRERTLSSTPKKLDPFATFISCTAERRKIHRLTISKWARALGYAVKHKPQAQPLRKFLREMGGINNSAAKASRLRRRPRGKK
jgi:hypothetical protein